MSDPVIDAIVKNSLDLWNDRNKHVINKQLNLFRSLGGAIPVCWFGDLDSSKPKILTIGANPSRKEFIQYKGAHRFNNVMPLSTLNAIIDSYNSYFRINPYTKWFNRINPLLQEFDASYYDTHRSIAIHLDVNPIPTYKSTELRKEQVLMKMGVSLSQQLIDHLIANYNVQKIIIVGGYNCNLFCNSYNVQPTQSKKNPYYFTNSISNYNYNFIKGFYCNVPFYGTSIYLPNTFFSVNYKQIYHDMMNIP